jgi:predicted choloylglycine hydrolase
MESQHQPTRQIYAQFSALSGSPYEIGQQIGQRVMAHPALMQAMQANTEKADPLWAQHQTKRLQQTLPDLYEEMQGTADLLKITPSQLSFVEHSYRRSGYCSQMVIPGSKTAQKQPLLARSYEFADALDEMNLSRTQSNKHYAHIGSSMLWFGRYDGLNEKGLAISMSAGGIPVGQGMLPAVQDGFQFWTVIRAVLDRCASMQESIDLIRSIPHCGNPIYMLLDAAGAAARVEVLGNTYVVKELIAQDSHAWLAATNHFQDLEEKGPKLPVFSQSHTRLQSIENFLQKNNKISEADLRAYLDLPYPQGLCCNYYQEGFGTLRSMIFDPQQKTIQVRFGTPLLNEWKSISLAQPPVEESFPVNLVDEKAPEIFWKKD